MGPATTKMTLDLTICELQRCNTFDNHLTAATSKMSSLTNLRSLTLRLLHTIDRQRSVRYEQAILDNFSSWLLAKAPCLEALSFRQDAFIFFSLAVSGLDRLKHLELRTIRPSDMGCLTEIELPVLETLCINGINTKYWAVQNIDLAKYGCLRQLAMKNIIVPHVIRLSDCKLNCHMNVMCVNNRSLHRTLVKSMLSSAEQVELYSKNRCSFDGCGMFASLPRMQVLKVSGKALSQFSLLTGCMPKSGLPVESLRVLILHGGYVTCRIPVGFPNLEELIVRARGYLSLDFEDPKTTFNTLKNFYAYGQPLTSHKYDQLCELLFNLSERGLRMEVVTAAYTNKGYGGLRCDGLYLRPLEGEKLSIGVLYNIVSQLARQCRCGACFTCLRATGCIE